MIKYLCKTIICLLVVLLSANSIALALNIDQKVTRMRQDGKRCAGGWSKNTGVYFLAISSAPISKNIDAAEATEIALANAKKEMAAFMGQQISAATVHKTEESTVNDNTETKEFFSSVKKINVSEFLRGVVPYKTEVVGNKVQVICYVSGKTNDLAKDLKAEISKLPPNTVKAVGIAMVVGKRLDLAKQQALKAAMRTALEQVLGTAVVANTQVQDNEKVRARIFSHAAGFIDRYRVVKEEQVNGSYRIIIIAKISKDKLLESYRVHLKAMGDPKFFIRTTNKELYLSFAKFFSGLGLKLVNSKKSSDYIIDAIGDFKEVRHPADRRKGIQLSLWIRISDTKTGQELLAQKNDPRSASIFYSSGSRQKDIAAEKAFSQIKAPLHKAINKMIGSMINAGRNITIVIDNCSKAYANEVEIIYKALHMVPACSNINKNSDELAQTVTMSATYQGKMDDLEMFLRERMKQDIPYKKMIPKTKSIQSNQLILTY